THPDITVEATAVSGGLNGLNNQIVTRLAAGNPPDMADNVLRLYYAWADQGALLDILPLMKQSRSIKTSDIIPGLLDAKLYKGHLYNAPTSIDPFFTGFDADMFEEAGLSDPYALSQSGQWSWASGLSAAQKLVKTAPDGKVTQYGWDPGNNSEWSWGSFITANGGRFLSEDRTKVEFDQEPAVQAMAWISDLYNQYHVGANGYFQGSPPVAMATTNSGGLKLDWTANKHHVSAAPIPSPVAGQPAATFMFADGPVIFKKADNAQAAWSFVEYLMSASAQEDLGKITGRVPGRLSALQSWAELASDYIGGAARAHVWSDTAANARLLPLGTYYNDMMAVLNPAARNIMAGKAPASTALKTAAQQVQAQLDEFYQKN
ncbi:MAG TPA: extracellular solute-binding protein, partial [Limnochordia bacterium]|nr:extracellular solute-binding protein [Limnochordia bacterium]